MSTIKKWNKWANNHSYWYFDALRILLGVLIVYKGFLFLQNPNNYDYYNEPLKDIGLGMLIIHTVVGFNIVGGIMIIVGFLTRWVIFGQLPIVLGAILINFLGRFEPENLVISILVLLVFVFFVFFGSGKHSVDYYLRMQA